MTPHCQLDITKLQSSFHLRLCHKTHSHTVCVLLWIEAMGLVHPLEISQRSISCHIKLLRDWLDVGWLSWCCLQVLSSDMRLVIKLITRGQREDPERADYGDAATSKHAVRARDRRESNELRGWSTLSGQRKSQTLAWTSHCQTAGSYFTPNAKEKKRKEIIICKNKMNLPLGP